MKNLFITLIFFGLTIGCSTSKLIISKEKISNLNSDVDKINCIVHNFITKNKSKSLFRLKYKFRIVVDYKDFEKNTYKLYLTEGFDISGIEITDLKNYLINNEIFNNSLIELKKERKNLRIIDDQIYLIINIKSLTRHDLKLIYQENPNLAP